MIDFYDTDPMQGMPTDVESSHGPLSLTDDELRRMGIDARNWESARAVWWITIGAIGVGVGAGLAMLIDWLFG
jgi:hypothetical protein